MKNKEELAKINKDKLKKVAGGTSRRDDEGSRQYVCYNLECKYYGLPVSATVGPPTPYGGNYFVCNFCSGIITTKKGNPIIF